MRAVVLLLGLGVSLTASTQEARAQQSDCRGEVDGHIVDAVDHAPVAGAEVAVAGEVVALSDEQGHFRLAKLCPGALEIEVQRGDYQPSHRLVSMPQSVSLEFELWPRGDIVFIEGNVKPPDLRSSFTVDNEALARHRGQSFSDALVEVPGVSQLRAASGLAKPIVRGLFGRRLLLLVDGLRHRSQDWGLDHAPEADAFIAEEIDVVRGAAGVRYGPDAIGGAIVVKTPALLTEPGRQSEVHWVSNLSRGATLSARYQEALGRVPGLAYQLEASATRLTAPSTPDYALDNTGSQEWSVGGALGYRKDESKFELRLRHYDATLGVCSCQRLESSEDFFAQLERSEPVGAEFFSADFPIERAYQRVAHSQLLARAEHRLSGIGTLTLHYGVQHDHRREFEVVRTSEGPQFDFLLTSHDVQAALEHKPIHLSDHLHMRGELGLVGMYQLNSYQGFSLIPNYDAASAGVYGLERWRGHDFEVEVGARYDVLTRSASIVQRDFFRLVRSEQLAEDACGDTSSEYVDCNSSFHSLSATIGGLWQVTNELALKTSFGTASRAPNPDEQYLNGTAPSFPVLGLGKPDLSTETTYASSLTASYQSPRIAAEASIFGNYIDDYIYFAPALNAQGEPIFDVLVRGSFPRFTTRPVDSLFYGADGGIAVDLVPGLELGGQLSIVRARNLEDDSYLSFIPADRVRSHLAFKRGDYFARATATYVAKQTRVDANADLAPPPDAYLLVDAEAGMELRSGDTRYRLALSGTNLLNQRYRDYTSLLRYFADQPGWQAMVRLSVVWGAS